MADKVRENRARRAAQLQGLTLVRSRRRDPLAPDYGWHVWRDRRHLAQFRDLDGVERWLAHPESTTLP